MTSTPLNPDALTEAIETIGRLNVASVEPAIVGRVAIETYLAVAQPVVTTFEESDALPVGSVVLDVDGNTARRFPDGWRTTVVEADGRVWLSGHMEDPDLPARVLYRPEVNDA